MYVLLIAYHMKVKMENRNCFGETSITAISFDVVQKFVGGTTVTKDDSFLDFFKIVLPLVLVESYI